MAAATKVTMHTMLGNYANTKALKSGEVTSNLVDFDFVEVKVANNMFKSVVRDAKYDLRARNRHLFAGEVLWQALRADTGRAGQPGPASHHRL